MNKADTGKVMDLENITWVTNQRLCDKGLLEQAKIVLKANPRQIILREKHLSKDEYISLAADFKALCEDINVHRGAIHHNASIVPKHFSSLI